MLRHNKLKSISFNDGGEDHAESVYNLQVIANNSGQLQKLEYTTEPADFPETFQLHLSNTDGFEH